MITKVYKIYRISHDFGHDDTTKSAAASLIHIDQRLSRKAAEKRVDRILNTPTSISDLELIIFKTYIRT